jgi:DNA mismatch endonuclease (patch repair protein)
MRGNRKADTKPELALRSALHRRGLRFRVGVQIVAGGLRVVPDIVFTRARAAIFVDGCFWHGCAVHGVLPTSNVDYWGPKLAKNTERDHRVDAALAEAGWEVIRVWEHQVQVDLSGAAIAIASVVRSAKAAKLAPRNR